MGTHSLKFGVDVRRRMRFDQTLYYNRERLLLVHAAGAPNDVGWGRSISPNYLLGLPNTYSQGSAQSRERAQHGRCTCSRRIAGRSRPSLTLNYGLRWEFNQPLYDAGRPLPDVPAGRGDVRPIPCQLAAPTVRLKLGYMRSQLTAVPLLAPPTPCSPLGLVSAGRRRCPQRDSPAPVTTRPSLPVWASPGIRGRRWQDHHSHAGFGHLLQSDRTAGAGAVPGVSLPFGGSCADLRRSVHRAVCKPERRAGESHHRYQPVQWNP